MWVMYDSTTPGQVPHNAHAVAGYVGGHWPDYRDMVRLHPHAQHLSIAVTDTETADCLDVETGDAKPDQAPNWVGSMITRKVWRPCVYADLSNMPKVLQALTNAGFGRHEYRLWVAEYTGKPHIPDGYDACQWTDKALGRNLDESLCHPDFFPPREARTVTLHRSIDVEVHLDPNHPHPAHWVLQ